MLPWFYEGFCGLTTKEVDLKAVVNPLNVGSRLCLKRIDDHMQSIVLFSSKIVSYSLAIFFSRVLSQYN